MKTNAEYLRAWRKAHPDRDKAIRDKWRKANPDKVREINHRQYERRKALKLAAQKGADTENGG